MTASAHWAPTGSRYGGGVCESNTPRTLFTPHVGFEDRGAHQDPFASRAVLWGEAPLLSNRALLIA